MEKPKLVPYCVYVTKEMLVKLKKAAKSRQASALVREGIEIALSKKEKKNGDKKRN